MLDNTSRLFARRLVTRKPRSVSLFGLKWKSAWTVTPKYITPAWHEAALGQNQFERTGRLKSRGGVHGVNAVVPLSEGRLPLPLGNRGPHLL